MRVKCCGLAMCLGLAAFVVPSRAALADPAPTDPPEKSVGLDLGVEFASAYVWRGYNIFQDTKQRDQNAMVAPSLTVSLPETGLSFGYWGAYQLNGDNKSALVDAGVGAEQDLILGYELGLSEQLTAALGLTYYFFPLADEQVAGSAVPCYIEPTAKVTYAVGVDLGLLVAYFHGFQEQLKLTRHVYISPSVSKRLPLSSRVSLEPKLSVGYKHFNESEVEDNVYDVLLGVGVPIAATDTLTVSPSVNAAWTNLSDVAREDGSVEERGFGDEYVVWAGVAFAYSAL